MLSSLEKISNVPYGLDLAELVIAARAASRAILEVYDGSHAEFGIQTKSDDSPVTRADVASDEILRTALARILPWGSESIVSEEHAQGHGLVRERLRSGEPLVFVDPLDGTKEFIKRSGQFVINVGISEHAFPTFGLVHAPITGESMMGWTTEDGMKGWSVSVRGVGLARSQVLQEQAKVHEVLLSPQDSAKAGESALPRLRRSGKPRVLKLLLSGSAPPQHPGFVTLLELLERAGLSVKIVRMGSALKFCRVADGSADLYLRRAPTSYWDTVAGQAIVEASGGAMVTLALAGSGTAAAVPEPGARFRYAEPDFANPGFAVFGATVSVDERREILAALR